MGGISLSRYGGKGNAAVRQRWSSTRRGGGLFDVDAVVGFDLGRGNFAVHEIADQRSQVALCRLAKAAAAPGHDRQMLALLDPAAGFARDFFPRATVFFQKKRAEAAVAAFVKPARREGCAVAAHVDRRGFG